MAHLLMTFSLKREIATVITAESSPRTKHYAAGGRALASCCQIHVHVEQTPMRVVYTLVKHPMYPVRRESKGKKVDYATTLPLEHFVEEWDDDPLESAPRESGEEPPPADDEITLLDYFADEIDE